MSGRDRTGKRAAFGAAFAAALCATPPLLVLAFGAGVLAFFPTWLDFVLVPIFLILSAFAVYRWWRRRSASRSIG